MMLSKKKVGFIGAGTIASIILRRIVEKQIVPVENIYIYDIDETKVNLLCKELGIRKANNNQEVIIQSDLIILAIKPQYVPMVLKENQNLFTEDKVIISLAAGLSTAAIDEQSGGRSTIIRVMPNTPALVGEGMTVICKSVDIPPALLDQVIIIFASFGRVEVLEEQYMDAVTALSGSSPAFVFMFIEAMSDGGVWMGLPRDVSYRLAAQAVLGSAKMVLDTGMHPGVLKDMVSSPGGTTIEALQILEKLGLRNMMMEAVKACAEKSKSMEKEPK